MYHSVLTSLEVEQEPPVAEVEVGVVPILVHQLKHLTVQDLKGKKIIVVEI